MPELFERGQPRALPQKNRLLSAAALLLFLMSPAGAATDLADATRVEIRSAIQRSAATAKPPQFTRQGFLRLPTITDVKLSPDGRFVAFRKRGPQQTDLFLQEVATGQQRRALADVGRLETAWSGDGRLLWLADADGLAIYDPNSGNVKRILKWDEKRRQRFWGVDANAPASALMREKLAGDGAWRYRMLRVDASGKTELLHEASQPLRGLLLNSDGSLAFTAGYDGPQYDTVIQQHHAAETREVLRCIGAEQCSLLGYNAARDELLLLTHHEEDKLVLKRWHAGQLQTVHRDPNDISDAASVLWQNGSSEWLAIAYHPGRRHWFGRDAAISAQLAVLDQKLPDASLELTSTADGSRWLVQAKQANWEWDRYYLYTPAHAQLQRLFTAEESTAATFPPEQLASAMPLHYRARDGAVVHGYLYLPLGIAPAKAPLIAVVHGGPFNRDRDYYNSIVQLLANRGYAVFTPNFRASTSFGQHYLKAPRGNFGNSTVLNDIVDGLDFLLAEGVGDRNRQAISGHSFGGYASLLAVSHYPTRFRYAVGSAAPVDFDWVMQEIVENGGSALPEDSPPGDIYLSHYGANFNDVALRKKLVADSPLAQLGQVKSPLYLWAGAKDDRVPLRSLSHYAGEAKRLNKSVTLLIDPDAGHSPETALNLEALVYLIESAAAKHFGGALTPPSPELQIFLERNLRVNGKGGSSPERW